MHSEASWVLVSSGTQVQLEIILEPDFLPDYRSVSYDYDPAKLHINKFYVYIKEKKLTQKKNTSCRPFRSNQNILRYHKCLQLFCNDCDLFIHETLHTCPGCSSRKKPNDGMDCG